MPPPHATPTPGGPDGPRDDVAAADVTAFHFHIGLRDAATAHAIPASSDEDLDHAHAESRG